MASVHGMYEHAQGTLKHRHKLEFDNKEEHTHHISSQLNLTQRYSRMLKGTQRYIIKKAFKTVNANSDVFKNTIINFFTLIWEIL